MVHEISCEHVFIFFKKIGHRLRSINNTVFFSTNFFIMISQVKEFGDNGQEIDICNIHATEIFSRMLVEMT